MNQDSVHHKTMITQVSVHFSLSTDYAGICTQPRFCDERRLNSSQNHGLGQTQFCDIFGGFQNADPILWLGPKRRPAFVAGVKTPTRFCGADFITAACRALPQDRELGIPVFTARRVHPLQPR